MSTELELERISRLKGTDLDREIAELVTALRDSGGQPLADSLREELPKEVAPLLSDDSAFHILAFCAVVCQTGYADDGPIAHQRETELIREIEARNIDSRWLPLALGSRAARTAYDLLTST